MPFGYFHTDLDLKIATKEEVDKEMEKYPFAKLLVEDFKITVIGLGIAIIGNFFQFLVYLPSILQFLDP